MGEVPLNDHAHLAPAEREAIRRGPGGLRGLDEIFAWGRRQTPPVAPVDVIKQDEFTHDVLMPFEAGRWLVYGTT